MKKLMLKTILPLFLIAGVGLWRSVFATTLPSTVTHTLDRVVDSMSNARKNLPSNDQRVKYSQVVDFLNKIENHLNTTQKLIANYIADAFSQKLADYANWTIPSSSESLGESTYQIANVDMDKARQARQTWHNDARASKWLPAYKRDTQLESTAHNRATVLATRNLIDHSSHKRDLSDAYYDYSKILARFNNLWVYFDESQGTAFAENVAYQYYSCNKSDCTQDLINAIKKGREFFMSEASYNGPHYRWIMSSNFTTMWMWIAFVWKRYWIVTHYGRR